MMYSSAMIQWIPFIDVAGRTSQVIRLDDFLEPMHDFWKHLETECVAACCGIDAFNFSPENIRIAAAKSQNTSLPKQLTTTKQFVQKSPNGVYICGQLNQLFDGRVLIQLLDHISNNIELQKT